VGLAIVPGANPVVRNNIFYRNRQQVVLLPPVAFKGTEEHSSRFLPDAAHVWTWRPDHTRQPVFEHNDWYPDWPGKGASDLAANPRFVGPFRALAPRPLDPKFVPDFRRARAYRLAKGSPCLDRGMDVGLPFRGPAPDLGAFEFGSSGSMTRGGAR
jgi:hypothetical protein